MNQPLLAFVVPCYNEEATLQTTIDRLTELLQQYISTNLISEKSFLLFVNDGSADATWQIIKNNSGNSVKGLKLSNNVGHQNALLAGLHFVNNKCDCCISIDADLQDDIAVTGLMVEQFINGSHIVYGVRNSRKTDSAIKKFTAHLFYKIMKGLGCDVVYNHADFRLLSNKDRKSVV